MKGRKQLLLLAAVQILAITIIPLAAQPGVDTIALRNLSAINSDADDYAPFITPNGSWFYFTSSREGSSDLYRATRTELTTAERLANAQVNSDIDEGICSVPIPAHAQLYYLDEEKLKTLGTPMIGVMASGGKQKGTDAELLTFELTPDGSKFFNLTPLVELNSEEWESQPSISSDGNFIIFTSTRKGGYGDKDLYISYRGEGGRYQTPMNLGSAINTSESESSPFIAPDGKTLFFSSDGHDGYGGADLFMSRMDVEGNWSAPKNLGPAINTDANELFFYGVNRHHCYFVSDRDGGKGGFDIYEATPNPFMPDYAKLLVRMQDTVLMNGLDGHVKIVDTKFGGVVEDLPVNDEGWSETMLLSGFDYRLEARTPQFVERPARALSDFPPDTTLRQTFNFGGELPPPPEPEIALDFEGMDIPLFVSGYYRMNTVSLLQDLRKRQASGNLKGQAYIADVTGNTAVYNRYKKMAEAVEKTITEFRERSINEYFPHFLETRKPEEYLEITVYGYADPRPVSGSFAEEEAITFYGQNGRAVTVYPGEPLDNFKLAGLRAYYSAEHLDQLFRETAESKRGEYARLVELDAIRWIPVSGNVDDITGGDNAEKRRIRVSIQRKGGNAQP